MKHLTEKQQYLLSIYCDIDIHTIKSDYEDLIRQGIEVQKAEIQQDKLRHIQSVTKKESVVKQLNKMLDDKVWEGCDVT